jgi:hypothetical protein
VVGAVGLVVMGQDTYDPVGLRVTVTCIYNFSDRAAVASDGVIQGMTAAACTWLVARAIIRSL